MPQAAVQVTGLRENLRALEKLGVSVADMKDTFQEISLWGVSVVRPTIPRRSGALAGSVRGNRAKAKASVMIGRGRTAQYAGPILYGWPARNIRPASTVPVANKAFETEGPKKIEAGLDKLTRKALR